LILYEGRYHQARRMFAAVGNHVEALHRCQFGGLTLGDLAPGKWRYLGNQDRDQLLDGAGVKP
jgi:16S rRNA pseudouridine516 synthase